MDEGGGHHHGGGDNYLVWIRSTSCIGVKSPASPLCKVGNVLLVCVTGKVMPFRMKALTINLARGALWVRFCLILH